jgi:UDP-GlcNAc:undecaprenyl-phosphate GlcNAc-1-phosphate transferase
MLRFAPILAALEPLPADGAPDAALATGSFSDNALVSSPLDIFHGYMGVFVVSFLVALFATPLMRRLAVNHGIVDRPNEARKAHRVPIAYLGGIAVFLGIAAGIAFSFFGPEFSELIYKMHAPEETLSFVPFSVLLGMTLITITGLWDDVFGLDPRLKVAGQLLAAAALALDNVGVRVAQGVLAPIGRFVGNESLTWHIPLDFIGAPSGHLTIDLIYWAGTAIIAIFVLGACNASNLIDGLDGLLSGVTSIAAIGLAIIAVLMAAYADGAAHDGRPSLDAARIILCLALLGGCLGFLPHNFNPATIFLGDCGSLLLGYLTITIILTLGDTGKTHFVIAGLIIYSIPIIDTVLAIVRRKLSGRPMSAADDQHLHHMLKRALGVKGAAFALYAIGAVFAALGVWLTFGRVRVVFTIAMVIAAFIGVTAVKIARRQVIEHQTLAREQARAARLAGIDPAHAADPVHAGAPADAPPPRPA